MIIGTVRAFAIRGMASDGAYAIRPYTREDKNLTGIPDALIFFCFFSCIKARKEE